MRKSQTMIEENCFNVVFGNQPNGAVILSKVARLRMSLAFFFVRIYHKVGLVGILLEFHLHLISRHISVFDDVTTFKEYRRSEFYEDETLLA
jgi:hypothetical protein